MDNLNLDDVLAKAGLGGLDVAALEAHIKNGGLLKAPCMTCAIDLVKIQGLMKKILAHLEKKGSIS